MISIVFNIGFFLYVSSFRLRLKVDFLSSQWFWSKIISLKNSNNSILHQGLANYSDFFDTMCRTCAPWYRALCCLLLIIVNPACWNAVPSIKVIRVRGKMHKIKNPASINKSEIQDYDQDDHTSTKVIRVRGKVQKIKNPDWIYKSEIQ